MQPRSTAISNGRVPLRRGEVFLWLPWTLGTLLFSIHVIGAKLFLAYLYGWDRVQREHLAILHMPKGSPWPVSNGDLIPSSKCFIHFLI
jgi:hypothetical protein